MESQHLTIVVDKATGRFSYLSNSIDPDEKFSIPTVKVAKKRAEEQATKHVERYLADTKRWKGLLNPKHYKPVLEKDQYALFLQQDGKLVHYFWFDFGYIGPATPVHGVLNPVAVRVDAVTGAVWGEWWGRGGVKSE